MARKIISLLLLSALLSGCGSSFAPTATVHAGAPALPDVGPDSLVCGPADQGDTCTFIHHVKDVQGNLLFYCQGETHVFPLTHTMSWHLEIGVSSLIADPNLSGCLVPLPDRVIAANMKGTLSLAPWTGNVTSIATWVYSVDGGQKSVLYPGKIAATKGIAVAVPMEGNSGQPLVFPGGHAADNILVWFNIDLPGSVPATISLSGASDTE
jgi:hypothetical protein